MAKAKKSSDSEGAAKKPAAKKAEKTPAKATAPSAAPMVDTSFAAESAARMLAARVQTKASGIPASTGNETAMFKQMKSGLSKPASQTMSNLLDKHGGPEAKKSGVPFNAPKQVGHNQTFGADVNRAGVPRRTGGG